MGALALMTRSQRLVWQYSTVATWELSSIQPAQTWCAPSKPIGTLNCRATPSQAFEDEDAYHVGNTGAAQAMNEAEQHKLDG